MRTVVATITLSLDGRTTGPGGEYDTGWIVPHAISDDMVHMTGTATTALLGRENYQGFAGYRPSAADDPRLLDDAGTVDWGRAAVRRRAVPACTVSSDSLGQADVRQRETPSRTCKASTVRPDGSGRTGRTGDRRKTRTCCCGW
ncbi:hypothetical protein H4W33_002254 [Kibdelosporangium phytohabitans]|nr:hypothetical protein [Kibdelosporangium phytohabitans]